MFTFIIRRDREESDVSRFSLAYTILKTHCTVELKKKFFFRCELCDFACLAYFYSRIAGWNNIFGRVAW